MEPKLPKGTLEKLWNDRANWRGPFYYCKSDPRGIVPKRVKWMGWTVNFAHRSGRVGLLVILLRIAILSAILIYLKESGYDRWMYALLAAAVVFSLWDSVRKSSPDPFEESA